MKKRESGLIKKFLDSLVNSGVVTSVSLLALLLANVNDAFAQLQPPGTSVNVRRIGPSPDDRRNNYVIINTGTLSANCDGVTSLKNTCYPVPSIAQGDNFAVETADCFSVFDDGPGCFTQADNVWFIEAFTIPEIGISATTLDTNAAFSGFANVIGPPIGPFKLGPSSVSGTYFYAESRAVAKVVGPVRGSGPVFGNVTRPFTDDGIYTMKGLIHVNIVDSDNGLTLASPGPAPEHLRLLESVIPKLELQSTWMGQLVSLVVWPMNPKLDPMVKEILFH